MAALLKYGIGTLLRSTIFNILFYVVTGLILLIGLPFLLAPRRTSLEVVYKGQARAALWLLRVVCGIDYELRGLEKVPPGAVLLASKHQSEWETFALSAHMNDPAMVMKKELFSIPVMGWFSSQYQMIGVDRATGPSALRKMSKEARSRAEDGRQIIIFPEGTRKPVGSSPDYKSGISLLYDALDIPVVPVALNSGLYWPRGRWLRFPGTIVVEFLDPIEPGMARKEFVGRLRRDIETASDALIEEARSVPAPSPVLAEISKLDR